MSTARIHRLIALCLIAINIVVVFISESTYDSGDSVLHYLLSKQAFQYPKYFFSHWAKPFFVLLSSPFTQFGFIGMKLFNTTCILLASFVTYKLLRLKFKEIYFWQVLLISLAMPDMLLAQSSGFTEPLFALMLMLSIWLWQKEKLILACLVFSVTPFVRSEAWVLMAILAPLLIGKRDFKALFSLSIGTIAYSIIGGFYNHNFLWVFNKNPYQGEEIKYGTGSIFHFFDQFPYMVGLVILILFILGHIMGVINWVKLKKVNQVFVLCFLLFWGFFGAHSIFWYKGLFHSFGLKRVFIAVLPLVTYISAFGLFTFIEGAAFKKRYKQLLAYGIPIVAVLFLFTKSPMALKIPDNFERDLSQQTVEEAASWLKKRYNNKELPTVSYANHHFGLVLDVDFDNVEKARLIDSYKALNKGSIVLWDSYFAESDKGISLFQLQKDSNLNLLQIIKKEKGMKVFEVYIYEVLN